MFILIMSNGDKTLSNAMWLCEVNSKRENGSLPVAVRISKMSVKLPILPQRNGSKISNNHSIDERLK